VRRVYHLDRGYERLDAKLAQLGARVVRQTEREPAGALEDELLRERSGS
jgi:hypothetical protein